MDPYRVDGVVGEVALEEHDESEDARATGTWERGVTQQHTAFTDENGQRFGGTPGNSNAT